MRAPAWLVVLVLLGCPTGADDDAADDDAADDDVGDDDAGDDDTVPAGGTFRIVVSEAGGVAYASVSNPVQASPWWVPELEVGDCVFHRADLGFCDPPCVPPEICAAGDECVTLPEQISAGDIVVEGLASALTLEVQEPYLYYTPAFDPEPVDGELFDAGDPIVAAAAGDTVPAFQVQTTGVAELVTDLPCPLQYQDGQPLSVTWTPASQGDTIHLELRSGNHGTQFAAVICDTADDGELVVDAAIVDAYLAEWRPVELWQLDRHSRGTVVAGENLVQLRAASVAGCMW